MKKQKRFIYKEGFEEEIYGCPCYDTPISVLERCVWCQYKDICRDSDGELADRDSNHCRYIHFHIRRVK